MDILDNLSCPQYVNFSSVIDRDDSIFKGLEVVSSPASSDKGVAAAECMYTRNDNSYLHDQSNSGSLQSSLCDSYLENVYNTTAQESPFSAGSSCQVEDFPVNRLRNLSLPENGLKKKKVTKTTKVEPFHFAEAKKRKRGDEGTEAHVPLAEQVAAFQKKTPERFHTTGPKSFEPMKHWSPHLVVPKSPNLRAAKRQRKIDVMSREELEQQEAEEIKRYRFRARPLNHNLLNQAQVPKIRKKTPTKPKSLKLRTAQRAAEIHAKRKSEEKPYEFHARPVPKAILDGPVGLKEKPELPVTQPKTPNFALKTRAEKWKSQDKVNETMSGSLEFKAQPAPTPSSPFIPKYEKKRTIPEPFSFDSRDKELMAKKEKKIQEEIEKENVFVFKAQPMPSPAPSALPQVPKKMPTLPQPFSFNLEEKNSRQNSFNATFNQTYSTFKAKPATVLEKPPFVPEKPEKQPLEVMEFNLHTDVRAVERQKLKEIQEMKEQERELILQRQKELEEERERREIQKLRKEIVHKANPVPQFKPFEIKHNMIAPTVPVTPKFKTDERLQLRH